MAVARQDARDVESFATCSGSKSFDPMHAADGQGDLGQMIQEWIRGDGQDRRHVEISPGTIRLQRRGHDRRSELAFEAGCHIEANRRRIVAENLQPELAGSEC